MPVSVCYCSGLIVCFESTGEGWLLLMDSVLRQ